MPIARAPEAAWTFVATRRKLSSGVRWKIVAVPPTSDLIVSTTGVGTATSLFLPSHWLPTITRGRLTGVTSLVSWFLASQVTTLLGESSMRNPPAWARTYWATARSESTLAAVEAPWVDTTS